MAIGVIKKEDDKEGSSKDNFKIWNMGNLPKLSSLLCKWSHYLPRKVGLKRTISSILACEASFTKTLLG